MTSKMKENLKNILPPGLYIVSTPIGNLSDITFRAIDTLKSVDLIACEDTRVSKVLLSHYGINTPTTSVHNYNESDRINFIAEKISAGFSVALISDAGTPLISDPGYKLSSSLRASGFYVTSVPGPSSPINALALAGFPTNRFTFIGFVPAKQSEKVSFFQSEINNSGTVVFFETANRLVDTLKTLCDIFSDRKVAIVREMTKVYEEVLIDTPQNLLSYFTTTPPRGEFVCLVHPPVVNSQNLEISELSTISTNITRGKIIDILKYLLQYMSLKDASSFIANTFEISKKMVYNLGLELKTK